MGSSPSISQFSKVLVSDFDGTMTRHDFYKLAIERLLPANLPDYWAKYRTGELTHFEALKSYFEAIRAPEQAVVEVVEAMGLDPDLPAALQRLQKAQWSVVITSAGCEWYIRHLLGSRGIDLQIYSNPGRFEAGRGLVMELPYDRLDFSPTLGIDKEKVVRRYLGQAAKVAFAGDGFPDAAPARLVAADLRFARGDLADVLRSENLPFHPFETWSDIARTLAPRDS